ncbi:ParA family protein [Candidatus Aquiluna sp. UB-MaderosW2red]|uniref:ParA family protein n=1 Tax=Candidatus Aquiluna sp. UB-MaderosW2red TaxID=1855377 RepID=UPI000875C6F2|nr:AAA family ATPase [Candidatus Aquiluna sp. UB-MaderosW2red]SCX12974.1 chromosome partitioning protein [Candidatus Aquiluna sp. UB-MaderosW2red]
MFLSEKVFPVPATLKQHGPARIIAMCNQKGGVGKTTTTINLAASLAEYGRKVLVVDFDPQGALSVNLAADYQDAPTIYELMMNAGMDPHTAIQKTEIENLDIIPANIDLSAAEMNLVTEMGRERILDGILAKVKNEYDVIFIDCQPSLGLLTVNALTAAHGVLIPMATEFFALRGVALLVQTIEKVKARTNPSLTLDGLIPTMHDNRTLHAREVLERLREAFPGEVFDTAVDRTVKFPDATVAGKPITTFAPNSEAAEAYRRVARELVARGSAA